MTTVGSFTDASCDTNHTSGLSDGSTTSVRHITHTANARIVVGSGVSGTGIPTGTFIVKKNTTTCFTISADTTATNTNTTLTFSNITNVFAMGKASTEGTTVQAKINETADSAANYTGNFLESAIYKTPLNPLLSRGMVSLDFADFTMVSNATAITSYEIHLADYTPLTDSVTGINISNSSTQTYSSVNRIYPNTTTVNDYLSNLETTKGHVLKTYDYLSNVGQRLITERTTLSGNETSTDTTVAVASATNLAVNDVIIVNNEEMLITATSGTNLTVERGYNNTTATAHSSGDLVYEKDLLDNLWVLVYSDDPNTHHFAKITEILEHDIYGDAIEFTPSLSADIPKDTKFAIFKGGTIKTNDTLVACAYGLQSDSSNNRHYMNTHVSKPFFYFTNGKDRLEPATRYILRTSSWNGSAHTYTYSTFLTEQAYNGVIVDSGPFTMEATLVDMMYKADNPAAMNFLEYTSDNLELANGTPDAITIVTDGSFTLVGSHLAYYTNLDGTEGTNWSLTGILKDSRLVIDGAQDGIYCIDSDSTQGALTMDAGDFSGGSTSPDLIIRFLAHAVDLDHNKMYCAFDSTNHLKNSFRMAHRPNTESSTIHYQHNMGQSRYAFYTDSPLTNTIIPNMMEMIDYEGVSASGGYVDIVFADTQKILAKKIQQNDSITIHQVIDEQEVGSGRNIVLAGTFEYNSAGTTITVKDLNEGEDLRYLLEAAIPNNDDGGNKLFESFTVMTSSGPYHILPDTIGAPSSNTQTITVKEWRKYSDALYTTTTPASFIPAFSTNAYRKTWSFVADNVMLPNIPIDSKLDKTYAQIRDFEDTVATDLTAATVNEFKIGETVLEKASESRIHDINLILRGGQQTGFRTNINFGDSKNQFVKLKNPLLFDKKMSNLGKEPIDSESELGYDMNTTIAKVAKRNLSNVSFYGPNINPKIDGGSSNYRYDLDGATTDVAAANHVRGTTSYLDYFTGAFNIEKKVFSGVVDSIEQVVEDGMFKLKIRGRDNTAELLGPIINQTFKFTEDIVYSTVGPFEQMTPVAVVDYHTGSSETSKGTQDSYNTYNAGATIIVADMDVNLQVNSQINKGDLMFNKRGDFVGRIHNLQGTNAGKDGATDTIITFEEGIPLRLKDGEWLFASRRYSSADLSNRAIEGFEDDTISKLLTQPIRGNTVSFAKAMAANPYSTTRVNSLLGAANKGIIFNNGNSLSLSADGAPYSDSTTLVGTSSSSHPLAKGYSISSPNSIDYDLPFYSHLSDEITDKYTVDYTNLETVSSITNYDVVNITSENNETIVEIAPICPAILARVDDNPLDGRDKTLVSTTGFNATYSKGFQGPMQLDASLKLKLGDALFDSDGVLFGKVIDFSDSWSSSDASARRMTTLDRPLSKDVTASTTIHKYFSNASPLMPTSSTAIAFGNQTTDTHFSDANWRQAYIFTASTTSAIALNLQKLKSGMKIELRGSANEANCGVFTVDRVRIAGTSSTFVYFTPRKHDGERRNASGYGTFTTESATAEIYITVLTDHHTQGLYFLNTQGLSQGGVLTLTNPSLSSPNAADGICKPIKWAENINQHFTDNSITLDYDGSSYTPAYNSVYSDFITRYGNTKWRYFGLQTGRSLSYINRRRKDGKIKDTYTKEKGLVSGYATAYRVADASHRNGKLYQYPYSFHNNDFAWDVRWYFPNGTPAAFYQTMYDKINKRKDHPYFLETLSPESRDFKPVMGSNFADFDKYPTYRILAGDNGGLTTSANYRVLNVPRNMPRMHDNWKGGDWQHDTEVPENPSDTSTTYKKLSGATYQFAITTNETKIDYSALSSGALDGLVNSWVQISGAAQKANNRTVLLGSESSDVITMDAAQAPYRNLNVVGGDDVGVSANHGITVLYPPWIGPKFDGITRAKDHWELPDPKTLRWFIFSPADLYPDSMSRKHHIGYSGIIDGGTAVSRKFTDYGIMLKGQSSFSSSGTQHEYYEGSLNEEQEVDDQYEVLPITEASITPSEMKRFGLMRLIECTYDWHFNLIDPERMPRDMTKMTTPNFEYTRYQPLRLYEDLVVAHYLSADESSHKDLVTQFTESSCTVISGDATVTCSDTDYLRVGMLVTGTSVPSNSYIASITDDTHFELNANATGSGSQTVELTYGTSAGATNTTFRVNDHIFTPEGRYIGTVLLTENSGSSTTGNFTWTDYIRLKNGAKLPITGLDETTGLKYYGPIASCTNATGSDYGHLYDSFYQFQTMGRGGTANFCEPSTDKKLNMLQMMWNSGRDGSDATDQVYYGNTYYDSGTSGTNFNNRAIGINNPVYRQHFGRDTDNHAVPSGGGSAGTNDYGGLEELVQDNFTTGGYGVIALPVAFKTYYHYDYTTPTHKARSINALQEKTYLTHGNDSSATTTNTQYIEYAHPSNILESYQAKSHSSVNTKLNPYNYMHCVALGRYSVEDSVGIKTPIGGVISTSNDGSRDYYGIIAEMRSKPSTGTVNAAARYGDGVGDLDSVSITNAEIATWNSKSKEYSYPFIVSEFDDGSYAKITDKMEKDSSAVPIYPQDTSAYIADGVFCAFKPILHFRTTELAALADVADDNGAKGYKKFTSINGNTDIAVLKLLTGVNTTDFNTWLNHVDLTGMYLVGNYGYPINGESKTNSSYPFDDGGTWSEKARRVDITSSKHTSMNDAVIEPRVIHYVYSHRRNATGGRVSHELLIDNVTLKDDNTFFTVDTYRVMRPAEVCLWPNSPDEIDINTLSSSLTKRPNSNQMYETIPSMYVVDENFEFKGSRESPSFGSKTGELGENEAVLSMYVAVDMDSKHAQYKQLTGNGAGVAGSKALTHGGVSTAFETDGLLAGDKIKIGTQFTYVDKIEDETNLTLTDAILNAGTYTLYLANNTYTVLRDYIHLFNPTGNRGTFKNGEAYGMYLTDGNTNLKTSMGVECDYYDVSPKCSIKLGKKVSEPMVGIISFGETFFIKSNIPTKNSDAVSAKIGSTVTIGSEVEDVVNDLLANENIPYDISDNREYPYYIAPNFQGVDLYTAVNFAAKYKDKEVRVDETGLFLRKQTRDLDLQDITLSYKNTDLNIIEVSRNKSTFDLYNEVIVYGSGVRSVRRNRASIEKFKKKTLEDVNMELTTQDDVDKRAISLLRAHSEGDDRLTIKMGKAGIEFVKAGDIITVDLPEEGITKSQYKIYEIRRELAGLIELEVGTYRKDLAARFAELAIQNKSNTASIRGSNFLTTVPPLDFFDKIKLKELRLIIKRTGLADATSFTLGFQTLEARKLDFGTTMGPADVVVEIVRDVDLV